MPRTTSEPSSAFNIIRNIAATAAPVVGGIAGTALGGPFGGAIGASAGGIASQFIAPSSSQQNQMTTNQVGSQPSGNWFSGYGAQAQQLPRFTPEQQSALSQLLSQGMSQFNFPAIEEAARSNFQSKTIPSLAERFASMGSGNRGSSGYGAALGRAGAGFEQQLAALKSQHGLGLLQAGLTPSFENIYIPQTSGFAGAAGQGIGQGVGSVSPMLLDLLVQWLQGGGGQQQAQKQGVL
jgi:hypothetical protein